MRSKAITYFARVLAAMCATPASAATYNDIGSSDAISGNYLTASVELIVLRRAWQAITASNLSRRAPIRIRTLFDNCLKYRCHFPKRCFSGL